MDKIDELKLSVDLKYWRAEGPDEWIMDRFIRKAEYLEAALLSVQAAPSANCAKGGSPEGSTQICARCGGDVRWTDGVIHAKVCEKCFRELAQTSPLA